MATRAGWLATALALAAPGAAAGAITVRVETTPAPVLVVTSDADDAIVLTCDGDLRASRIVVNGVASDASCQSRVAVVGGPGPNRIDLGDLLLFSGNLKGPQGSVRIEAGAGDDEVTTPRAPYVLATVDGGPGSDRLVGGTVDTYVFGPAQGVEVDTLVETAADRCDEPWQAVGENPPMWDVLDLSLVEGDVAVDGAAPGGVLATTPGRTIRLERGGTGAIAVESASGGPGDDRLAGLCFAAGNGGDDLLGAAPGGALLLGGSGTDVLRGGAADDLLVGGAGDDRLLGGAGSDDLSGQAGDDVLRGGAGDDVYRFAAGDGRGHDVVDERPDGGSDVLSFDLPPGVPASVQLGAEDGVVARWGRARASVLRARQIERVVGGRGDDLLVGDAGANVLQGGGGRDVLAGGRGDDAYAVDPVAPLGAAGHWLGDYPVGAGDEPRPRYVGRCSSYEDDCPGTIPAWTTIDERPGGGVDTIVARGAEPFVRIDLAARSVVVRTRRLLVDVARPGGTAFLEGAVGTNGPDVLLGNAADNVLEGQLGRDTVRGGPGRDTCVIVRPGPSTENDDDLGSCERTPIGSPYRSPFEPFPR
ncbi:MAG: calcium-binding protein [Thermoleophilia bacterium]